MKMEFSVVVVLVFFSSLLVNAKKAILPSHIKPGYWLQADTRKRASSYPFISGDTFRDLADHVFDETRTSFHTEDVAYGDIVFVNADYIDFYFKTIHPEILNPYILVTHNSLFTAPGKHQGRLIDPMIIAWFAKNVGLENHPKLYSIPLGLANGYWPHGNVNVVKNLMKKPVEKDKLLYLNFLENTHTSRAHVADMFKDKPFCFVSCKKPFAFYMKDMARSKFVLSPRGAGIDCHRTWEALLVGSIPIVPSTTINSLYENLPVLVVDDWLVINEEFLNQKWQEMKACEYDYDRMFMQYWVDKIKTCQLNARKNKKGVK